MVIIPIAWYVGTDFQEYQAVQLTQDISFGIITAKSGDWLLLCPDGQERICPASEFGGTFRQKYPRLAGDTTNPPTPSCDGSRCA